jgi:esterase/lipase
VAGTLTKCTYTSGLSNSGYASAIVYYPCSGAAPYAGTTLTGGYTNTKEDMAWLGSHLVTHGYIIIAMTPNNIYGTNSTWKDAHKAGIAMLKSENSKSTSPIYGKVNTSALQIMGFSKGGGGALLASAEVGTQIKATQALAPYMDSSYNISGIRSATICYTGTADIIASPSNVVKMYDSLPTSVDRALAYFNSVSHTDWYGSTGSYRDLMKSYITSWMKVYLNDDTGYDAYIDGSQSWFYLYEFMAAGTY